jgi:hypothetical protein
MSVSCHLRLVAIYYAKMAIKVRCGRLAMSDDHFVSVRCREYAALNPSDRKQKIRELVSESRENEKFIRENFPKFFAEAFAEDGSNGVGRSRYQMLNPS